METTGSRIAYLRGRRSMSQQQLAETMSVSQSTVGMWESNKRNINNEDLVKLADLFDVTTDYLLGRQVDDNLLVAAHMDDDLTDEQKKEIEEYIEFKKALNCQIKCNTNSKSKKLV
ncbi:helix-turn-helix domain-containing protein [Lapidilactobacillus bayanensis]|uniref:helix-turn-helix domain-containing protein n=1 Tax=Lapidilactobacillus bayanensis TaxID=2485998 RepID=UPI000F774C99|nr:helix-turn-helix transcriptional regulator [Lapidilactobacillus bayanensis]